MNKVIIPILISLYSLSTMACDEFYVSGLLKTSRAEEVIFESHSKLVVSRSGLPPEGLYEILLSNEEDTFRHYSSIENIKLIQKTQKLIAGHKTSFITDGYQSTNYKDISGVFMTHTDYVQDMSYVDFKIPVGTPVLHLKEMGANEFVILGDRSWKPWFVDEIAKNPIKYQSYLKHFNIVEEGKKIMPKRPALEVRIRVTHSNMVKKLSTYLIESKSHLIEQYHLPNHFIESYYERRILPYLNKNRFTGGEKQLSLYRGMLLSMSDLIEITQNGMSLDAVEWRAGGNGISFSSNIEEAISYIFQNTQQGHDAIGVVFKVDHNKNYQLLNNSKLNPGKTIYKLNRDLGPNEILDIYLYGEYGLENINTAITKTLKGDFKSHTEWTNQFR